MTARRKPKPQSKPRVQSKLRVQDLLIVCAVGLFVLLLFVRMLVFVFGHRHWRH